MEERIGEHTLLVHGDSGHLIVAFGSVISAMSGIFEFHSLLHKRGDALLLFRDEKAISYHAGFAGITRSIEENVEFIRYIRHRLQPERMTCLGISSGGYCALLHGYLAGADDILTVNPRTYVSYDTAKKLDCGPRLPRQFDPIYQHYAARNEEPRYLDLRQVFEDHHSDAGPIFVHYSSNLRMDVVNTGNIAGFPRVELIEHHSPTHEKLGAMLRDQGVLDAHLDTPVDQLHAFYRDATFTSAAPVQAVRP